MAAPPGYSGDSILQQPASPVELKVFQGGGMLSGGGLSGTADSLLPQPDTPIEMKVFQGGGPKEDYYEKLKKDSAEVKKFFGGDTFKTENLKDITLTSLAGLNKHLALFIINNKGQVLMFNENIVESDDETPPNVILSVPTAFTDNTTNESYNSLLKESIGTYLTDEKLKSKTLPEEDIYPIYAGDLQASKGVKYSYSVFIWVLKGDFPFKLTKLQYRKELPGYIKTNAVKSTPELGSADITQKYIWMNLDKALEIIKSYKVTGASSPNFTIKARTDQVPWRDFLKKVLLRIKEITEGTVDDPKPPPPAAAAKAVAAAAAVTPGHAAPGPAAPLLAGAAAGATGATGTGTLAPTAAKSLDPSLTFRSVPLKELVEGDKSLLPYNLLALQRVDKIEDNQTYTTDKPTVPLISYFVTPDGKLEFSKFEKDSKQPGEFFLFGETTTHLSEGELKAKPVGKIFLAPFTTTLLNPGDLPISSSSGTGVLAAAAAPGSSGAAPAATGAAGAPGTTASPTASPDSVTFIEKVVPPSEFLPELKTSTNTTSKTKNFGDGEFFPRFVTEDISGEIKTLTFTEEEKKLFRDGARLHFPFAVSYILANPEKFYRFWKLYVNNAPIYDIQMRTIAESKELDKFYSELLDEYRRQLSKFSWQLLVSHLDPAESQDWLQQKPDTAPLFDIRWIKDTPPAVPAKGAAGTTGTDPEDNTVKDRRYKPGKFFNWPPQELGDKPQEIGILKVEDGQVTYYYGTHTPEGRKKYLELLQKVKEDPDYTIKLEPGRIVQQEAKQLRGYFEGELDGSPKPAKGSKGSAAPAAPAPPPVRARAKTSRAAEENKGDDDEDDEPPGEEENVDEDEDESKRVFYPFRKENYDMGGELLLKLYTLLTGRDGTYARTSTSSLPDHTAISTYQKLFDELNTYRYRSYGDTTLLELINTELNGELEEEEKPTKGINPMERILECFGIRRLKKGPSGWTKNTKSIKLRKPLEYYVTGSGRAGSGNKASVSWINTLEKDYNPDSWKKSTVSIFSEILRDCVLLELPKIQATTSESEKQELLKLYASYEQFIKLLLPKSLDPKEKELLTVIPKDTFDQVQLAYDAVTAYLTAQKGSTKGGGRYSHTRRRPRNKSIETPISLESSSRSRVRTSKKAHSK